VLPPCAESDDGVPQNQAAIAHETLMQYPPAAEPRFAEARTQAQALEMSQQRLQQKASEAAENLARAKARLQALTGERQQQGVSGIFSAVSKFVKKVAGKVKKALGGKKKVPPDPRKLEDCCGCRFVWSQVEMDIGSARYIEDVQASFEHNCMDAQKSSIFYPVVSIRLHAFAAWTWLGTDTNARSLAVRRHV
jgi:hypothetical protein